MPTVGFSYRKEKNGDFKGLLEVLSKKGGSRYEDDSEAGIVRKLLLEAFRRELKEGTLRELASYLSNKKGSLYYGKRINAINKMIIRNALDSHINSWLEQVNK